MLTIVKDEVVYKLGLEVEIAETGTEDSSDTAVLEPPPASPPPKVRKQTSPPPRQEAGTNQEVPWKDIDLSTFGFPEAPFKLVRVELMELQNQYFRMEHITRGVNQALNNCGPGNILRELAKRTDRKQVETLETEKAQLMAQVTAMTQELAQKSEEIRKYLVEQVVVLSRVRELVGHPGEVVNKAYLYDQLMESTDPSSARQMLQILVKYSCSIKDLLKEIQKLLPPSATPRRMLYPGPPGSPTCTLYEVIWKVELVSASQAVRGPVSQQELPSRQNLEEFRIGRRSLCWNGPACPMCDRRVQNGHSDQDVGNHRIRIRVGHQSGPEHWRRPELRKG